MEKKANPEELKMLARQRVYKTMLGASVAIIATYISIILSTFNIQEPATHVVHAMKDCAIGLPIMGGIAILLSLHIRENEDSDVRPPRAEKIGHIAIIIGFPAGFVYVIAALMNLLNAFGHNTEVWFRLIVSLLMIGVMAHLLLGYLELRRIDKEKGE